MILNKNKQKATRKCDECGLIEETNIYLILRGRKRRNSNTDLCKKCSNSIKYKKPQTGGYYHKNFKHGISSSGYKRISINGVRNYEHILIMEEYLGRKLQKGEYVHHINLNKIDNKIENLFLCKNRKIHSNIHYGMQVLGINLLGKMIWFDYENKIYVLDKIENNPYIHIQSKIVEQRKFQNSYIQKQSENGLKNLHVLIMEEVLNRKLNGKEHIHHIDLDKWNNIPKNLCIVTNSEHRLCHDSLEKCVAKLYENGHVKFDMAVGGYYINCSN